MDAASLLHAEVQCFKQWAAGVPATTRSGEWECDYPQWESLREAAKFLLDTLPTDSWTEEAAKDFLYALARDNEDELIAEALGQRPEALLEVARRAVDSAEPDAKWQVAAKLGELHENRRRAEAHLVRFVRDRDEYVSRRALLALGQLRSEKTEEYAERAWRTGHEYQRIAALWALKECGSAKLSDYLREAEADGREYVLHNAKAVRSL